MNKIIFWVLFVSFLGFIRAAGEAPTEKDVQALLDKATKLNHELKAKNTKLKDKVKSIQKMDEGLKTLKKNIENCKPNGLDRSANVPKAYRSPLYKALLKRNPNLKFETVQKELVTCLKK
ncbi:hypothetical protein AWZ03_002143 [Drosophila navojoa]|uniref:Uncharacterized protein n=1 Tax=Drosophila navojoa TaxID=7232 RepID=A0A484BRE6_DRONA|nr:uncharacterized protein LOC108651802 [Drosophila navojoa]TDG51348.1 hypothetical protein AWZ03_002143 [Drosophila navojoa]